MLPVRAVVGHLAWARDGTVWACWRVPTVSYAFLPDAAKVGWHARWEAALLSLPQSSLLLSVCRRVTGGEVAAAMADGVDLDRCPVWADEVAATEEALSEAVVWQRRHYLAVRLPEETAGARWRGTLAAAAGEVAARFGLPPSLPSRAQVEARLAQATQVAGPVAAHLRLHPVPAGELRWLYARAARRGIDDLPVEEASGGPVRWVGHGADARAASPALRPLGEATLAEGLRGRLRVETEAGVGWQRAAVCYRPAAPVGATGRGAAGGRGGGAVAGRLGGAG